MWLLFVGVVELVFVVDDFDVVGGLYVYWIVIGIVFGFGSMVDGQIFVGGYSVLNFGGW